MFVDFMIIGHTFFTHLVFSQGADYPIFLIRDCLHISLLFIYYVNLKDDLQIVSMVKEVK